MFDFQCEQTAGDENARRRDQLTGALIGLARATEGNEYLVTDATDRLILEGLVATSAGVSLDDVRFCRMLDRVEAEKRKLVSQCYECAMPCGKNNAYDMRQLWNETDEEIRSVKFLILSGIRGIASYAYQAWLLNQKDESVYRFLYKALIVIGIDGLDTDRLLSIALEAGEVNLKCMAMLDKAGTRNNRCDMNGSSLRAAQSWYEQKAVSILLTLLHLETKNVCPDAARSAVLSANMPDFLAEKSDLLFGAKP